MWAKVIAAWLAATTLIAVAWAAPQDMLLLGVGSKAAGGGGSSTAWTSSAGANNAATTVSTTTTNNDTVTSNSGTLQIGNRATGSYSSGKVFILYKILTGAGGFQYIGFCNSSTALNSSGTFCATADANGVALELANGVLRDNSGANAHQFNGGTPIGTGYWVEMAWDITNNKIWVRVSSNGGSTWASWDDVGGDNPSTNTGGLTITVGSGPFMLYYADNTSTTGRVQLDCSSATYTSDTPTGFSAC